MFEVLFSIALVLADGRAMPPYQERVATIEECVQKVEKSVREFAEIKDQAFVFAAGCVLRMKPSDPA